MSLKSRVVERVKQMTLTEVVLCLLLVCAYGIYDRLGDANEHLQTVAGSVEDVTHAVTSESADIQTKLDEQKSSLDDIAANQ